MKDAKELSLKFFPSAEETEGPDEVILALSQGRLKKIDSSKVVFGLFSSSIASPIVLK